MVNKIVNKMYILLFIICGLSLFRCEETVSPPNSMRLDLKVTVIDTTGFSEEHCGSDLVDSASVYINSISYYTNNDTISDSLGNATFIQIIPDRYNVSISKRVTINLNEKNLDYILNGQIQDVNIFDDYALTAHVYPSLPGQLLISELYYNGSPPQPPYNIPQYFHDQFTEIYNNSDDVIYLDSVIVADLDFGHADEDFIYAVHANMFPGSGHDYPLYPGEFIVLAQDAIDHTVAVPNSVNLSGADFEYFVGGGDVDQPNVENMIKIHHKYGIDVLYSVFNDAVVLLKVKDPYAYGYSQFDLILFPKSAVIDGVDYRDNLAEVEYKRLDASIDAGLTGGFEAYKNKSVHRKIDFYKNGRAVLMDNNNSSIDFQVLDHPTPGYLFDE
ncbi:MAG: DUF4876 domain-containing protein [Candidatus Marinimicrobia bacterium]|nr:DUF4876 domain-containing protein [Candidatus Neomarinimicrobiota bacterium]